MTPNYDKLLDPPNGVCQYCEGPLEDWDRRTFQECRIDWADEQADQQIQTEKEGK